VPLTIQLHPSQKQTAFNLERWRELLGDRDLARLPHRIETDRHGHILMSPPPAPSHGVKQARIATLFDRLLPEGVVITECPVSTSDGVKAIDIAWLAPERRQEVDSAVCFAQAPEVCVEILSPSNTSEEISEKIALTSKQVPRKSGFATRMELLSSTTRVYCRLADRPRCARSFRNVSILEGRDRFRGRRAAMG
jgi:Putative restriction endonuclease